MKLPLFGRVLAASLMVLASGACEPLEDEPPEEAEPGEGPEPGEPVRNVGPITEITPKAALAGQKLTVTIKIAGETAGPGADVSFGAGIDVIRAVEVPGGLAVDIEVQAEAAPGPRDVDVIPDDAAPLKQTAGFAIASAMDVVVSGGKAEQGGLVQLDVASKDGKTFEAATFELEPEVASGVPSLLQIARGTFTTTTGRVVMLGDPLARPGVLDLVGQNRPLEPLSDTFYASAAVTVAPRPATPIASGATSNVTLAAPLQTGFYEATFAPPAGEGLLVDAWAKTPAGSTLEPVVYAYGALGSSDDLLDVKRNIPFTPGVNAVSQARVAYPVTAATKGFFTIFDRDLKNAATATLGFELRTYRATIIAEQGGAHGVDAMQNLGAFPAATDAVPGRIVTGTLGTATEIDAYQFKVPLGAPFRNVQISVVSEAEVDIIIDHVSNFADDTTTFSNVDRATSGLTSDFPLEDRYIRISATPSATKPTGKYTLGIRVVD